MDFRFEIQGKLRSVGINPTEANKTVFGIATIGLLIGKDNLELIIYDRRAMENRENFIHEIMSQISDNEKSNIAELAFRFIPDTWDGNVMTRILEIILDFDLKHIVLELNIYDDIFGKECSVSDVSWINNLVIEILKLHGGKTLYNVDSGTSYFITEMCNKSNIERAVGNTCTEENLIISQIKSYFSENKFEVELTSLFSGPLTNGEKVDMVYNSYPLMFKYDKEEILTMVDSWDLPFIFKRKYSADLLWMVNSLQCINSDGIVVALVPNGILFNNVDVDIRKYLVENNYIDTIISLPEGILPFSNLATSLVIMKKNNSQNHKIRMVDATEIFSIQKRHKFFEQDNIACIVDLYTKEENTEKSFNVTLEEIAQNDFYLGINRYFSYALINPCALGDVTRNIFRGYQINAKGMDEITIDDEQETSEYRIINISDIQSEGFVSKDLKAVRIQEPRKVNRYCVKDGDIIITAKNTTIKSAIYRSHGDYKAILTGNLIAIRANEAKINPYYLKAFLDSEQGQMVLKSVQTGTTIISLNLNSLKDMKISLLPAEHQEQIADRYKTNLNDIQNYLELYETAMKRKKEIYNEILEKN